MLISNKVIELNNQIRNEKLELQQECDMIYYELDPISKLRLNRIGLICPGGLGIAIFTVCCSV